MTRLDAFKIVAEDPWLKPTIAKLPLQEIDFIRKFLEDHKDLDVAAFRAKAHYLGVSTGIKVRADVVEVLGAINTTYGKALTGLAKSRRK